MIKNLTSIKSFKEGLSVKGFFLCTEKHLRHTRGGDLFLDIELRDMTGLITAKIWNNIEILDKKFESGNAVAISGVIESFKGKLQLIIKKINKATVQHYGRYGFDPGLIVPKSDNDPEKMWAQLVTIINTIQGKNKKYLTKSIFKTFKKQIMYYPASINNHYNFRSGFLEHLVMTCKLANKIGPIYNVDQGLLITGTLLYDIGVIKEINSNYEFDYTDEGRLIGRRVLGKDILNEFAKNMKNFPKNTLVKLNHIVLSRISSNKNEKLNFPSFPEAILINMIISFDMHMNMMNHIIKEDQEKGNFTNKYNYYGIPIMKNGLLKK
jgi:3'-5' exoribonuclease